MSKRKLQEIPDAEKQAMKAQFMYAPADAEFEQEYIAISYGCSLSLLQSWRSHGGGPPFIKVGRTIVYTKKDVLDHFQKKKVTCTAEYHKAS